MGIKWPAIAATMLAGAGPAAAGQLEPIEGPDYDWRLVGGNDNVIHFVNAHVERNGERVEFSGLTVRREARPYPTSSGQPVDNLFEEYRVNCTDRRYDVIGSYARLGEAQSPPSILSPVPPRRARPDSAEDRMIAMACGQSSFHEMRIANPYQWARARFQAQPAAAQP